MLQVGTAIPMIMGSNIGTSVTNTIVSLTQVRIIKLFRAKVTHNVYIREYTDFIFIHQSTSVEWNTS